MGRRGRRARARGDRAHGTQPRELRGVRRRARRRGPGRAHLRHDDGARRWRGGRAHGRGAGPPPDPALDGARLRRAAPRPRRARHRARAPGQLRRWSRRRARGGRDRGGRHARLAPPRGPRPGQRRRGRDRRARPALLRPERSAGPRAEGAHGPDQRLAVRGGARRGCRARRAGAPGARRERVRSHRRGCPGAARGLLRGPRGAVGRRARDGRAAVAARAPRRFGRRPPGAPGRRELPHPAAGSRPAAPCAGRGRACRGGVAALGHRQPGLPPARRRPPARGRDLDRRLPQRSRPGRDGRRRERVGGPVPAVPAAHRQAAPASGDGDPARARRVDDEAAAHGADLVGRGGARTRRPHAAVARGLRSERRAVDGLPRLAPRRRHRPLRRRGARDSRRPRRAGAARRGPPASARARAARR